jgi:hypothetical protein
MVPEVFGIQGGTGPVPVLKPGFGGIGGERLLYQPKDDWDCRRSTEERHGWSTSHKNLYSSSLTLRRNKLDRFSL